MRDCPYHSFPILGGLWGARFLREDTRLKLAEVYDEMLLWSGEIDHPTMGVYSIKKVCNHSTRYWPFTSLHNLLLPQVRFLMEKGP